MRLRQALKLFRLRSLILHDAHEQVSEMASDSRFQNLRALLVEPSAVQARIIRAECDEIGLRQVEIVGTVGDALDAMLRSAPDLTLSALYLPDGTGTELVEAMRAEGRLAEVPFLLISSETRPQALEPVRQSGACGILPKPFTAAQLSRAISRTLDLLGTSHVLENEFDLDSIRVLLVDDSPNARRFIRRVLENLGLRHFIEASNGREAAALLTDTMVDLIVTDYNMPEMDGREFVEYVRTRSWQQEVPILMVTSESSESRLAAVQEAGVSGICDKPFETALLQQLLAGMLRQSEDS
jgi:two-component system chemotaxis response regulator CheY